MSSVVVRNVPSTNSGRSAPHSSSQEEPTMLRFHVPFRRSSGIHTLPVELLTRVFVLGSALDDPYQESPFLLKPDRDYYPATYSNFQVSVSHVCQHWRQVALRIQSLWTTLHFRETSHIPRAEAYLSRCSISNTYPLDILVDTVAQEDHTAGITLYTDEIRAIFQLIIPHVKRWRAFHLKICDNECKAQARRFLGSCGPAPKLETLQLYHFEDYRTSHSLYLATYRPPVVVFNNTLPSLKNVSLIGVNLPWDKSPYLVNLHYLELALHPDRIRPPYKWWDRMLRLSPELKHLALHYSGPRVASTDLDSAWAGVDSKIPLENLEELSLTDLDPDWLCDLMRRMVIPGVIKLSLNLPDQDFTSFIESVSATDVLVSTEDKESTSTEDCVGSPSPTPTSTITPSAQPSLAKLQYLCIRALDCNTQSWMTMLHSLRQLRVLDIDFSKVPPGFWRALVGGEDKLETGSSRIASLQKKSHPAVLPILEIIKLSGVTGEDLGVGIRHRSMLAMEGHAVSIKWSIRWNERNRNQDPELDFLVDNGCWVALGTAKGFKVPVDTIEDEVQDGDDETDDGKEV